VIVLCHLKRNKDDDCSDAGIDYLECHIVKARKLRSLVFIEENV
jgi:hypothetical protein